LYVDDALRTLFTSLEKRPDWSRTIVVITGDHRLVPVPFDTRISRFRVPLIIASPMVVAPTNFVAISSHLDVTPTLLAHLAGTYHLSLGDSVHWMGQGLDTSSHFDRSTRLVPIMRTKTEFDALVSGTQFLDGEDAFSLAPDGALTEIRRAEIVDSLRR